MATWREMCNVDPQAHDGLELPASCHKLQRPHVAGFVWRVTCPDCGGEGCAECDQLGVVETVLSPAEVRRLLMERIEEATTRKVLRSDVSALLSALGIVAIILAVAALSCWQELARVVAK